MHRSVFDGRVRRPARYDRERALGVMAAVDAENANVVILDRFDLDIVAKLPFAAEVQRGLYKSLGLLLGIGDPLGLLAQKLIGWPVSNTLLDLDLRPSEDIGEGRVLPLPDEEPKRVTRSPSLGGRTSGNKCWSASAASIAARPALVPSVSSTSSASSNSSLRSSSVNAVTICSCFGVPRFSAREAGQPAASKRSAQVRGVSRRSSRSDTQGIASWLPAARGV